MGNTEATRYLPQEIELDLNFKFLGNHLEMKYTGWMQYNEVTFCGPEEPSLKRLVRKNYNLSNSYTLSCDTSRLVTDVILLI